MMKRVHVAGIYTDDFFKVIVDANQVKVWQGLNDILFDYCHSNKISYLQIPSLDDWERSKENPTYWSCKIDKFNAWYMTQLIEFK